jgi:hypothetical protein
MVPIISNSLAELAGKKLEKPVMFAPGRGMLCTIPLATGSLTDMNTTGTPSVGEVARRIACDAGVEFTAIISRFRLTSSAAKRG